jgi:hypothetical protein
VKIKDLQKIHQKKMKMTNLNSNSILSPYSWTAEKNKIDPMVCYEVAHELEMSLIENCRSKGFENGEIEVHKHIAEMNWKTNHCNHETIT